MGTKCQESEEIRALVAALGDLKLRIQMIFKSQNFSAMPAAQQRLEQMQKELRLLRYKAKNVGGDNPSDTHSPSGARAEAPHQRVSGSGNDYNAAE